ncbi:sensor histidine kinase [Noviherbaspirillum pedocola]|uniref:C4-dicarboxylate transport sensor protein DctB n=1 Tax=Noviherbaspirillum pedocola TaxID=2801341 RepID=A0A934W6Q9_9BURK|nr:sensor histidine kinase [Noviherbaspirillum pedocola]
MAAKQKRSRLLALFAFVLLVGAAGVTTYRASITAGTAELEATGRHRLDLYVASLEREIDKYAYFPTTLGLERDVLALLEAPSATRAEAVNRYLERLSERAGTFSIYILDSAGRVVASSNWRRPDNFIGEDLSFRPYFRQAMTQGSGRFFGIGTTRGEPGYYLSSALVDGAQTLGVAVVKVGLDQLENSWTTAEAPALVSDENGVVILTSVPEWKFTTLRPLDEAARNALDRSLQYNRRTLRPLAMRTLATLAGGAQQVRLSDPDAHAPSAFPRAGVYLAQSRPLPGTPWQVTVFSPQRELRAMAANRAALAGVGAAFLFLLGLMLEQRRRHLRDRLAAQAALQRAHDELERKVVERTTDLSSANALLQREVLDRTAAERTLRAAQDELVQAGKLAVIGQMAAGIAHELNQPLAALRTLSGNARKFLARGMQDTASANLERIDELVDRMGQLTAQLKSFARKSSGQPRAVLLRRALDNALFLLEQRLRQAHIVPCIDLPQDAVQLWCDPNRLEQILVNLVSNALDAMEGSQEPFLEIGARLREHRAEIWVRDRGPGISADAAAHLFEPFFTTKDAVNGLGLGLAISAGIAADFNGSLAGANHPDGGAVFTLTLPICETTCAT